MSANKWNKAEIWAWYLSEKVEKYKLGQKKTDKAEDKYNIRLRAVINGDRLIIGLWQGCKGERLGVYYLTVGSSSNVCCDGVNWHTGKLEYIPLGGYSAWGYTYNYQFRFISGEKEAEAWIKAKFGSIVSGCCNYDVVDYVGRIESTTSSRRRIAGIKRKQERINSWLKELPPYPSDLLDFVDNTVFDGLHYAFEIEKGTKKKPKKAYVCSVCKGEFEYKDVKHAKYYDCPLCGAKVRCDKRSLDHLLSSRITLIQPFRDIEGKSCPAKREMYVSKRFDLDGERVFVTEGSVAILTGNRHLENGKEIFFFDSGVWTDKNTWMFQHSKSYCYPDVSALEGTAYDIRTVEAAAKKGWYLQYNNLLQYFDEPRMEYLVKGDFYGLVYDITTIYSVDHLMKGNDIKSVLGLDGQGVARLRQSGGGVAYLQWLRAAFMCGYKLPEKTIRYFCKKRIIPTEVAVPLNSGASPEKVANYIEKQAKLCKLPVNHIVITWRDTLNMQGTYVKGGGSYTLFPKNLKRRHAELCGIRDIELHKKELASKLKTIDKHISGIAKEVRGIEEKYPTVSEVCESVKKTFEWSDGSYSVIVPEGVQDVLVEGHLLGHCIARPKHDGTYLYFERIEERESYVCFLRKNENLLSPWYTMEVEPDGSIRQLRTFGDDEGVDRDEAKAFLKKWRRTVKSRLGKTELRAAEVSREKRLQEFAELRKNQNKIYNGKLKGMLLADVLEADFAEFNSDAETA